MIQIITELSLLYFLFWIYPYPITFYTYRVLDNENSVRYNGDNEQKREVTNACSGLTWEHNTSVWMGCVTEIAVACDGVCPEFDPIVTYAATIQ